MMGFLKKFLGHGNARKSVSLGGMTPRRVTAKFDAAQTNANNSNHWAEADNLSADAAASKSVRKILRARARYEIENNSYARGMVTTLADITVGTGPKLQMRSNRKNTNKQIEDAWAAWSLEIGLAEHLRTMRMARAGDGEWFGWPIDNPKLDGPVKMDLRAVEADQVTDPAFDPHTAGDVDGIHYDEYGNPLFYTVLKQHPGGNDFQANTKFDKVPADVMMHYYRVNRAGQHRGIPEITPALPLFAQLRRFTLAVLSAAESAANFALVLQSDADANDESVAPDPLDEIELTRNMMTTMPAGWKLGQVDAEQPTTTYSEFKNEILGEVARCLQIPKSIALGSSEGLNYSSGRLDHQSFFRSLEVDRCQIEREVLDRILSLWLRQFQLSRGAFRDVGAVPQHEWFWDGLLHVDPKKEADATNVRLHNLTTTHASEFAKQGKDWEDEFEQIAREKEKMEELGITLEDVSQANEIDEEEEEDEQDAAAA